MAAPGVVGFNCVLTAGGITVGRAQNVDGPNAKADTAEVTTRSSGGWKEFKQALKEWDASIEHLWVPTDAALQALRTAYLNGSELVCRFLDDAGNGWQGSALVIGLNLGQALNEAVSFPVQLKGTGALTVVGAGS